jgi:hypothetical protein
MFFRNNFIIATISVLILLWLSAAAEASWLIDHERFHVSVHGQLSCQECHADISEKSRHPDPVDVNRSLTDFFEAQECAACHEDNMEEIAEGSHAGQETMPWQRFDTCIECHSPHYQFSEKNETTLAILSRPVEEKCSQCHDFQAKLPDFSDEDRQCLTCHLAVSGDESRARRQTADLCLHCHSSENLQPHSFPLIDEARYAATPHMDVNCLVCHPQAAAFGHGDQQSGDCRQCHQPHDEKITHDLHAAVTCGACHLSGVTPVRDTASGQIGWHRPRNLDRISSIHQMQMPHKDESCRSCHTMGNPIGAAAMVLPAKSFICMPCHAATLSVGDTVTVLSFMLFLPGLLMIGSVWFSGGDQKIGPWLKLAQSIRAILGAIFSLRILAIINSLILDGLLQRRLFRISKERWFMNT